MNNQWFVFAFLVLCGVVLLQGVTLIKLMNKMVNKSEQKPAAHPGKPNLDDIGLKLGESFPLDILRGQTGDQHLVNSGRDMLVLVTSSNCPMCKMLITELKEFAVGASTDVWVVHWGSGEEAMAAQAQMDKNIRVTATDFSTLQNRLRTTVFPLAYFVNAQGKVAAKDLATGRYQLMAMIGRAIDSQVPLTA